MKRNNWENECTYKFDLYEHQMETAMEKDL